MSYKDIGWELLGDLERLSQQEPYHPYGICNTYAGCLFEIAANPHTSWREKVRRKMAELLAFAEPGKTGPAGLLRSWLVGAVLAKSGAGTKQFWEIQFTSDLGKALQSAPTKAPAEALKPQLVSPPVAVDPSRKAAVLTLAPSATTPVTMGVRPDPTMAQPMMRPEADPSMYHMAADQPPSAGEPAKDVDWKKYGLYAAGAAAVLGGAYLLLR
jgi:hypothetical protein